MYCVKENAEQFILQKSPVTINAMTSVQQINPKSPVMVQSLSLLPLVVIIKGQDVLEPC